MDDTVAKIFQDLGISLALGLLVGLQREKAAGVVAGMRTFALLTVAGTLTTLLAVELDSPWIVAAALVGVIAVAAIGNLLKLRQAHVDPGTTTEIAILMMFALGAYVPVGPRVVCIAIGAGVGVLLQFKPQLHGFAQRLGEKDMRAVMQFVLITCIILPILPTHVPGLPDTPPLNVLNPYETWLMVVLIVGISLGGYVLYKFLGSSAGTLLGGVLGGAISSTATTVSYARRTRSAPDTAGLAAIAIMIASTVVYARVLLEIAVIELAPPTTEQASTAAQGLRLLPMSVGPIAVMAIAGLVPVAIAWLTVRRQPSEMPEQENPTQLKPAIIFGILYAGVLLALTAARMYMSQGGMFVVAMVSGLTDMDAITLSTARMVRVDQLAADTGWRLVVVAIMSNFVFKAGLVAMLGDRRLLKWTLGLFSVPLITGIVLVLLWPAA